MRTLKKVLKRMAAAAAAAAVSIALLPPVGARAEHREFPYDTSTPWSDDDVEEMIDYACYWEGRIPYKSSVTDNDPDGERFMELAEGRGSDCSWFVYHVLYRYGLVGDEFIHSYEWGNDPSCYPGAYSVGSDIDDAVPGDVICTGAGTKPGNSHVAIYIGDGQVVECCAGAGVIISGAPGSPRDIVHFECIPRSSSNKGVETD